MRISLMEVEFMSNNNWQSYFGKDTKVYIFKCKKCKFEDPVPDWLLEEFDGFSLLNKNIPKKNFKMTCPRCGKETMQFKNDNE